DAAEFVVNTATAADGNDDQDPDVAVNASGQFVITWWGGTFLTEDIHAKGYAGVTTGASGNPTVVFAEETVNSSTGPSSDDQVFPAVAIDTLGNFVVAYQSYDEDGSA